MSTNFENRKVPDDEKGKEILWLDTLENAEGQMELIVKYAGNQKADNAVISLELSHENKIILQKEAGFEAVSGQNRSSDRIKTAVFPCPQVQLWTPEDPVLYQAKVSLELPDKNGKKTGITREQKIGFRSLKRQEKQVFWNGKPVKLLGICYRERTEDFAITRKDLELFKSANINFIRSIYYPFSEKLLELCDEMGFWVENTAPFYELGQTRKNSSELPHMREEFERAAEDMLEKGSHVSVLLWSLGHDCAWGTNFGIIRDRIRELDEIRLMTFHLPMSIPEEEPQMDVWPVHDIDWRLPFDKTYDQMVIFHTPGADNEIGYMTADADYPVPVLHEVWSPVVCHNRDEIRRDPQIREFWGNSIHTFVEKSAKTPGCLGGAVLAGVDEDGCFDGLKDYEWGILDMNHEPKPEYYHLKEAYGSNPDWKMKWTDDTLLVENDHVYYHFSRKDCLLKEAGVYTNNGKVPETLITGGPFLNSTGFLLGEWEGKSLEICSEECAQNVQIKIDGTYQDTLDICFYLTVFPDGTLETAYEIRKLYRHMPHRVKAEIGISSGGLSEKGAAYYVTDAKRIQVLSCDCKVRLEDAPQMAEGALVDNRDERMKFVGNWLTMEDYCGNFNGSETLSNTVEDYMELEFSGTGCTLYGPWDINYGMCDIYLDGALLEEAVSQYPAKVDFPGMSRGYEKRYRQVLAEVHGLEEKEHKIVVKVTGKKAPGAQNTYTSIDHAVLEGSRYVRGVRMNINQDFNYPRMVRGCVRRPDVNLIPGVRETFRIRLLQEESR